MRKINTRRKKTFEESFFLLALFLSKPFRVNLIQLGEDKVNLKIRHKNRANARSSFPILNLATGQLAFNSFSQRHAVDGNFTFTMSDQQFDDRHFRFKFKAFRHLLQCGFQGMSFVRISRTCFRSHDPVRLGRSCRRILGSNINFLCNLSLSIHSPSTS